MHTLPRIHQQYEHITLTPLRRRLFQTASCIAAPGFQHNGVDVTMRTAFGRRNSEAVISVFSSLRRRLKQRRSHRLIRSPPPLILQQRRHCRLYYIMPPNERRRHHLLRLTTMSTSDITANAVSLIASSAISEWLSDGAHAASSVLPRHCVRFTNGLAPSWQRHQGNLLIWTPDAARTASPSTHRHQYNTRRHHHLALLEIIHPTS